MKKAYWEPELDDEIAEGLTWGEAKKLLPKVNIQELMRLPPDKMNEKMQGYTLARIYLEFIAGNPAMVPLISKLHVDPITARAKVQMILGGGKKGQSAGISYEGPKSAAEKLFERALSGDVHLPEGDHVAGMKALVEVQEHQDG